MRYAYEDFLLGGNLLACVHREESAVHRVLSLLLADACRALTSLLCQILTKSIFNMVANQAASSEGILWVSNFGVMRHIDCY